LVNPARFDRSKEHIAGPPAVIIFGPPWPRSGTARVIQNQIFYYRERGFFTVFIGVPFLWYFIGLSKSPEVSAEEVDELGADRSFTATLDQKRYNSAKFRASIRHAFLGTALDWQVAVGRTARLPDGALHFAGGLRTALFHVNHVNTLGFALDFRKKLFGANSSLPIILETHDIQSHLLRENGSRNPWTRRADWSERLIKSETALLKQADVLIHLSTDDFSFFQKLLPSKPQFIAFPTINENIRSNVNAAAVPGENIDLLFVGSWHRPNLAAIRWFLEEVWPLIAHRHYRLKIVGLIGPMVQKELPQLHDAFRLSFVGEVTDLIPYYRAARCVIAPMVSGSGISIKTIEALALGKPFVGTSKAFRGMPMERLNQAGIQAHDDPQDFANAIFQTLYAVDEAAIASRAAYEDVFSARAAFAQRDEALRTATASSQATPLLHRLADKAMRIGKRHKSHSRTGSS
jgi:glycosyltransferase involved in cell wall biosynthesis